MDQLQDIVQFMAAAEQSVGPRKNNNNNNNAAAPTTTAVAVAASAPPSEDEKQLMLAQVTSMGFDALTARLALDQVSWASLDAAVERLLDT